MPFTNDHTIDKSFGPWAGPTVRGGFDFTLRFEESILVIPLQCLFLFFLPFRIWQLIHQDVKTKPGMLQPAKMGILSALLSTNLAFLILYAIQSGKLVVTATTWPSQALVVASCIGLLVLSWLEHSRSFRPSLLSVSYLFLSGLLDIPRVRTLYMLTPSSTGVAIVFTFTLVCRVLGFVLENVEKRQYLLPQYYTVPGAMLHGPVNHAFFVWLLPLFRIGYARILKLEDMFPFEQRLQSKPLYDRLADSWEKSPDKHAPNALLVAWMKTFKGRLLVPVIPKLFVIGFTYSQPYLIDAAVKIAATPEMQPFNNWSYGLIAAFAISYAGLGIATGQYTWRVSVTATVVRGSVISLIYQELLRAEVMSPDMKPAAALTMMNTDIETIVAGVHHIHELWGSIVEIAIADFLIYKQLGAACAMPLSLAVVLLVGSVWVAIPTGAAQAQWIQASQDRVTATSGVLGALKWLKFSGITEVVFGTVRQLRVRELEVSLRFRKLIGRSLTLLIFMPIWSPILTFSVAAGLAENGQGHILSSGTAFTALSTLLLMSTPLSAIISALPTVAAAIESSKRVQSYLNTKKRSNQQALLEGIHFAEDDEKLDLKQEVLPPVLPILELGRPFDSIQELDTILKDDRPQNFDESEDIVASVRGTFAWTPNSLPILNISEWNIYRGKLNLVLGPNSCGKSTLLKCLLGELSQFRGDVWTGYSGIAYCDQKPWLPNENVRQVILGDAEYDPEWYRRVIKACALDHDLRLWPQGDKTMPGTQGFTMSGGQKQRISLARAVYARRDFVILDDVFSGLDSHTEERIFENLLSENGLLRAGKTTVVMASSNPRRAPFADKVIRLNENGQILEPSIWGDRNNNPFASPDDSDQETAVGSSDSVTDLKPRPKTQAPPREDDDSQEALKNALPDPLELELMDSTRRLGDKGMYGTYIRAAGYVPVIAFVVSMAIYGFCGSFPTVWLGWWSKQSVVNPREDLGKWLGVYVLLGVAAFAAAGVGCRVLLVTIINRTGLHFHHTIADIVSRAPMSYLAVTDTGTTLNRFSQDLQLIDMELPAAIFGVATCLAYAIAQLVIMSVQLKYMLAILPFLAVTFYILQRFYLRTSRQLRLLEIEYKAPVFTHVIESIDGLVTIRAFNWEAKFMSRLLSALDDARRPNYLLTCVQCWLNLALDLVVMFIAIIFVTLEATVRKKLGPSTVGIGLTNVLGLSGSAQSFVSFWVALEVALGAVARINRFEKNIQPEPVTDDMLRNARALQWPTEGGIEFKHVTASYTPAKQCLGNVNFSVKPGMKVALCGRTGSGKSSITLCLLRMLDLDSGHITIDGIDLTLLPPDFVRSHIVAHPQEVFIMDGTLRANVDPLGIAEDADIKFALKRVQLWDRLANDDGLDTEIDKSSLSPGEAQLLAFSRTLVRKSKILIVDELTSSLDAETTEVIDEILAEEFDQWTIIAVVHELRSVLDYDRVAVLDSGRLAEYDNPRALLDTDGSQFQKLWELSVGPIDRRKLGLPERIGKGSGGNFF